AQGLALGIVTVLGIFAVMRFRPEMRVAAA
ncbi:MAG: hypothetical protein QOH98_13, partial [Methylobacteriaceae bacterium]|nr:hypothetical protein [Methylobacteriaceae bacterium]